jgi:acyl dehydratase
MFDNPAISPRWFEDFHVGERFVLPSRAMSPDLFRSFAAASGESHPLHTDDEYCREREMPGMLAHGMFVAIQTVAGAGSFPFMVEESLVRLLDQSSRFARPVFVGDVLHPVLQVTALSPNASTGVISLRSTVHNQRRELVLEGTQRWLLRKQSDRDWNEN